MKEELENKAYMLMVMLGELQNEIRCGSVNIRENELDELVGIATVLYNEIEEMQPQFNKEYHYYKVDVLLPRNGYSFMLATTDELDEYELRQLALDNDLYEKDSDAYHSFVDDLVSHRDITHFKEIGCIKYL
jgi:hypothetical protein